MIPLILTVMEPQTSQILMMMMMEWMMEMIISPLIPIRLLVPIRMETVRMMNLTQMTMETVSLIQMMQTTQIIRVKQTQMETA